MRAVVASMDGDTRAYLVRDWGVDVLVHVSSVVLWIHSSGRTTIMVFKSHNAFEIRPDCGDRLDFT